MIICPSRQHFIFCEMPIGSNNSEEWEDKDNPAKSPCHGRLLWPLLEKLHPASSCFADTSHPFMLDNLCDARVFGDSTSFKVDYLTA